MRRFAIILLVLPLAMAFSGCGGGGSTTTGVPSALTVSPSNVSVAFGQNVSLSPSVTDASGNILTGQEFTFTSNNTSVASVSASGLVCGGTWDSTTAPVVCTPPTAAQCNTPAHATDTCTATITVASGSLTATVPVAVHIAVAKLTVTSAADMTNLANCVSVGDTATFTAHAFDSNNNDITKTVGSMNWSTNANLPGISSTQAPVVATVTAGQCVTDNTCVLTAAIPGQTSVFATVTNTVSSPTTFTTCPVQSLSLHTSGGTATSASLAAAGTQALATDVVDSKGKTITFTPQYNSGHPVDVSVPSTGNVTGSAVGSSTVVASCTPTFVAGASGPQFCNVNLFPVYSNPFLVTVTGTAATTTVYAASTTGTSLVPIDSGTNAAGTAITLPFTPNSIMFTNDGTKLLLGSNSGLMVVDAGAGSVANNPAVTGKVLAISPDSTTALVANDTNLSIYNIGANTARNFSVAGATSASWSPDSYHAYVVGGSTLTIVTPNATPKSINIGAVRSVDFLRQGSFAYLAGGSSPITVFANCNNTQVDGLGSGSPALIGSLPDASHVLAVNSPNLDDVTVTLPAPPSTGAGCPPTVTNSVASHDFSAVGISSFTPRQLIVTPDSTKAFITADQGSLLTYDVAGHTTGAIPLGGGITGSFTGGVTADSAFLYVGVAGTNTVHRIDVKAGQDVTQIPVSFVPDLVAVRPK